MNAYLNSCTTRGFGDANDDEGDEAARFDAATDEAAEAIRADDDAIRDLIADNIGTNEPYCAGSGWAVRLHLMARDVKSVLDRLCQGDTLEQAVTAPFEADAFRDLLKSVTDMTAWMDGLIADKATENAIDGMRRAAFRSDDE